MSLMRLLAAGRSIMGIKKARGPFRMSQENLLPKFAAPGPKAASVLGKRPEASASAGSPAESAGPAESVAGVEPDGAGQSGSASSKSGSRNLLVRLVLQLARRGRGQTRAAPLPPGRRPVQTELSLDTIKVVRNDLKDCDFEVIPAGRKGARVSGNGGTAGAQRRTFGIVWNRLSARLLRQAASEFELVQKERGKLLSQPGDGGGSARGT
jgi:hypothetical protein